MDLLSLKLARLGSTATLRVLASGLGKPSLARPRSSWCHTCETRHSDKYCHQHRQLNRIEIDFSQSFRESCVDSKTLSRLSISVSWLSIFASWRFIPNLKSFQVAQLTLEIAESRCVMRGLIAGLLMSWIHGIPSLPIPLSFILLTSHFSLEFFLSSQSRSISGRAAD